MFHTSQDLLVALCLGALSASAFQVAPTNNHVSKQWCRRTSHVLSSTTKLSEAPPAPTTSNVLEAIDELFPPQGLDQRMALSRKDGYWPFINVGDEPPQELVYGEFDTQFFANILHRAGELLATTTKTAAAAAVGSQPLCYQDWVFCDLGSGTGRLVLTAAALFPWKLCRGIELLEGIHEQAVEKYEACQQTTRTTSSKVIIPDESETEETATSTIAQPPSGYWEQYQLYTPSSPKLENDNVNQSKESQTEGQTTTLANEEPQQQFYGLSHHNQVVPLSPIELHCGSFTDPYVFFGDANIIFVYSSAMPYHILIDLARAIGRQCQPGTLIITTEYQLPTGGTITSDEDDPSLPHGDYEMELIETLHGENESTGGVSTVYIQRLTKALGDGVPRSPPVLPVSEIAYRVIQKLERGELNNPKLFLRNVSNQMAFLGLPESWRPKLLDD